MFALEMLCCGFTICCSLLDTLVSGSPIIQNGRIIGAVTHVLVNDSTKGYAIFLESMLNHGN